LILAPAGAPAPAGIPTSGIPTPPAPIGGGRSSVPQSPQQNNNSLDGWFLDRLFGRR
jgi:hypothetical protein